MPLVCLDSNIIIWAFKEEATSGQELMIPKAKSFIKWLSENKYDIMIPAVVLGEILTRVPEIEHEKIIKFFEKRFIITPYDAMAASKNAAIWNERKSKIKELQKTGATRNELKADCLIVSTAIVRKAKCIYSHDPFLKTFAEGYIVVNELPEILEQGKLSI